MSNIVKIFTDGGSRGNPGPAASGAVLENFAGNERLICGKYLGIATNNVAEYTAVILAMDSITATENIDPQTLELDFYTDSLLVTKQLKGEYQIKNYVLAQLAAEIKRKEKLFAHVSYSHVPREQNKLADREVNRVLDIEKKKGY